MKPKVGIFSQTLQPTKKSSKPGAPWQFKPSNPPRPSGPGAVGGTYYGSGVRNPTGKIRGDGSIGYRPVTKKQLGTPPKSLA